MSMPKSHVVAQGECLAAIAHRYGFPDPDAIWKLPENADLRQQRTPNVLLPGDVVHLPERKPKALPCPSGKVNRFRVRLPTRGVHVVLVDALGHPIAGHKYTLQVGKVTRTGKTGDDGSLCEKGLNPRIDTGTLRIPDLGLEMTLLIGHLDPPHEESGWRQRLVNLGYEDTDGGLRRFGHDKGLADDADPETIRHRLLEHSRS
jgi:hypothetical protein